MANKTHESLAAEATAYLENSAGAVGGFNGIQQEIRRQADCLLEWARNRGVFLTDSYTAGLEKYDRNTTEHVVYFGEPGSRVIKCTKCTKPARFGWGHGSNGKYGNHCPATPWFYLQRLELMNQEFPTDLRLEGIGLGKPDFGNDEDLSPYIVTSQLYIEIADKKSPHPSEAEVERFMVELGFRMLEDCCYNWIRESDGVVVTDTRVLNFINSHAGIVPIDLVIGRIVPEIPPATI
jgi:hypothetical protein